jgi:hypothetical protein
MIRHQQEMSLNKLEANLQGHTGISLIQMRDNYPTDMEDQCPVIGKMTMTTNEHKHYPL